MKSYGAKVVAFDAFFSEEDPNKVSPVLQKVKRRYLKTTKKRKNTNFLEYLDSESKKADTDVELANAIEEASDEVLLGYAFFTNEEEVAGIAPKVFEKRLEHIEDAQLQMVFPPEEEEILNNNTTFVKAQGLLTNIGIFSENTENHGFVNAMPDIDGPIRKAFMFLAYDQEDETIYYPSLALKSVMNFIGEESSYAP